MRGNRIESVEAPFEFPELLNSVEQVSASAQKRFYIATGATLTLLAAGSFTSLVPPASFYRLGSVLTFVIFLVTGILQVSGFAREEEKRWYDARAAAESIKAISWEFAVGGEAFRKEEGREPEEEEKRYLEVLKDILENVGSLDIGVDEGCKSVITETMKKLRAANLSTRYEEYRKKRVEDQILWYSKKAKWNKKQNKLFTWLVVIFESAAASFGLLRICGAFSINFLGPIAAVASGLVGWMQAKKYGNLAEAYGMASHEIYLLRSTLNAGVDEATWAQSVHDAEAAFSREHTMWQARRQSPRKR